MSLVYRDPDDSVTVYILNASYEIEYIIDTYTSFIWTERYNEGNDFELYVPIGTNYLEHIKLGTYITHDMTEQVGIVESIETTSGNDDEGEHVTITGRTLESVLDRRVVWKYTDVTDTVQNGIKKILNENVIAPSDSDRKIPNFTYTPGNLTDVGDNVEAQYCGDNVYEVVQTLLSERDIGWRVMPSGAGGFDLQLYQGVDHSYRQTTLPYVVFSSEYDNLISSRIYNADTNYKTVVRTSAEISQTTTTSSGTSVTTERTLYTEKACKDGAGSGLARREAYVSANIQARDDDGNNLSDDKMLSNMREQAGEALGDYTLDQICEADVDMYTQFVYGEDFELGDIMQVVDALGYEYRVRMDEVVMCWDVTGFTTTPSFRVLDE